MAKKKTTKKTKISSLLVYSDEIKLRGYTRRLVFNNRALGYAEQYCNHNNIELPGEDLLIEVSERKLRAMFAVLYGTIKAANEKYTAEQFEREVKLDNLISYFEIITKGLEEYLPVKRDVPPGLQGDGNGTGDLFGDYFELARQVLKMSDKQILDSSLRIIEERLKDSLGIEEDEKAGYIDSVPGF